MWEKTRALSEVGSKTFAGASFTVFRIVKNTKCVVCFTPDKFLCWFGLDALWLVNINFLNFRAINWRKWAMCRLMTRWLQILAVISRVNSSLGAKLNICKADKILSSGDCLDSRWAFFSDFSRPASLVDFFVGGGAVLCNGLKGSYCWAIEYRGRHSLQFDQSSFNCIYGALYLYL